MASEALAIADDVEPGRYEAQRRALGSLLARFTADRDALIASVHDVEARMEALQSRFGTSAAPCVAAEGSVATASSAEVEPLFAQIREEHAQSWEETKSEIANVRARADSAAQRSEQVAALVAEVNERAHEIAATRVGLQGLEARFDRFQDQVSEQLRGLGSGTAPSEDGAGPLAERVDRLEALTGELRDAGTRVTLQALEARFDRFQEHVNAQLRSSSDGSSEAPPPDGAALAELTRRLEELETLATDPHEGGVSVESLSSTDSGHELVALRARIDEMQGLVERLQAVVAEHESVADAAVANEALVELGERLSQLETSHASLSVDSGLPPGDSADLRETVRGIESAVAEMKTRLDEIGAADSTAASAVAAPDADTGLILDELRHQVSALREAAAATSGIRQVWGLVSVSALVAAVGLALIVIA